MREENVSRMYADFTFAAEYFYGQWDPLQSVQVGDYGQIDVDTGKFIARGNIYNKEWDEFRQKHNIKDPILEDEKEFQTYLSGSSVDVAQKHPPVGESERPPEIPECKFQQLCYLGLSNRSLRTGPDSRCGITAMYRARKQTIPEQNVLRPPLLERMANETEHTLLVTDVIMCDSYAIFLSSRPAGAPFTVGYNPDEDKWIKQGGEGRWKVAEPLTNQKTYKMFYKTGLLKRMPVYKPIHLRASPIPPLTGEELFDDGYPPWDEIDSDGEHIPYDEEVYTRAEKAEIAEESSSAPQSSEVKEDEAAEKGINIKVTSPV